MSRRCWLVVGLAVSALAVSCSEGGGDVSDVDRLAPRPEPSEPATGPVVAELSTGDSTFELHYAGRRLHGTVHRTWVAGHLVHAGGSAVGLPSGPILEQL